MKRCENEQAKWWPFRSGKGHQHFPMIIWALVQSLQVIWTLMLFCYRALVIDQSTCVIIQSIVEFSISLVLHVMLEINLIWFWLETATKTILSWNFSDQLLLTLGFFPHSSCEVKKSGYVKYMWKSLLPFVIIVMIKQSLIPSIFLSNSTKRQTRWTN